MSVRDVIAKLTSRLVTLNLLAMLIVVALLIVGVRYGLDIYTHHGEAIAVPDLRGMHYAEAYRKAAALGLDVVVSDSGHNKAMPANAVLAQTPASGHRVKQGRIIYVTVNSPLSPMLTIPDIVDNSSVREAEAKLRAMGFRLTPRLDVVGERDWVYGILSRGRRVSNGDRVSIDDELTLMVGKGTTEDTININYDTDYPADDAADAVDDFEEVTEP